MAVFMRRNNGYTRAEWVSDAVVHVAGVTLALIADALGSRIHVPEMARKKMGVKSDAV